MDDDKKTQSQWERSGDAPSAWQPGDFSPDPDSGQSAPEVPSVQPAPVDPAAAAPAAPVDPAAAVQPAPGVAASPAPAQPWVTPAPAPWQQGQSWGWGNQPGGQQPWQPGRQQWPPAPPAPPVQPAAPQYGQQQWPPAPPAGPQYGPPFAQQYGQQYGQLPGWQPTGSWQPPQAPPAWPPIPPTASPASEASGSIAAPRRAHLPQILTLVAACLISFSGGMVTDRLVFGPSTTSTTAATATASPAGAAANSAGPLKDFALYEQALQIVRENFVGRSDVTDQQLLYGSIRGMVDALGDTGHSVFMTPEEYQASQTELSGSIAGIGVLLATDNGQFTVTKVLPNSPALESGVKAGDQITKVDGVSVTGLSFDVFASKIRGKTGTKVTITVVRPGVAAPIDITLTRAVVTVPLVTWGMVPGTHVADIALVEFSQGASDQLAAAIKSATDAGATGIVFDLRGNPGGYASEAVDVASQFISTGAVYLTQDASGTKQSNDVNTSVPHTSLPMVVLVDHNSASAAEIVSGALQDTRRGKIVGESTYGTGTVLQAFKLSDGSAILLGTAYWLTPNGHKIFGKGITPDQQVALAAGVQPLDPSALTSMSSSQLDASGDAQLLAAIQDLTTK